MKVMNMSSSSNSQCYFIQLQIDSFLDGELGSAQKQDFTTHVNTCAACAQELHFAQTLHDRVGDLPKVDCDDSVLEPVYRITRNAPATSDGGISLRGEFVQWLYATPTLLRVAVPTAMVTVLAVAIGFVTLTEEPQQGFVPQQVANNEVEYTQEDVIRALVELNTAIEYLNAAGERTESMIGDRFLLQPLQESLNASFESIRNEDADSLQNDPI